MFQLGETEENLNMHGVLEWCILKFYNPQCVFCNRVLGGGWYEHHPLKSQIMSFCFMLLNFEGTEFKGRHFEL